MCYLCRMSSESSDSDRALCEMLILDEDPQVRAGAAQSLAARNQVDVVKGVLLRAAQQDKEESVRIASLFALTALVSKDQGVQVVVAAIAQGDSSEVVRKQAASLLQGQNVEK